MEDKELPRSVGRPRTFDRTAALDAALKVFWEHGYEAASLSMLCDAMGLTPPQVYSAYQDKETLFRLALDRYVAQESEFVVKALGTEGTAREAMANLLIGAARSYTRPGYPRGCMTVTAAIVAPPASINVVDILRNCRNQIEQLLAARLSKDKGGLPKGASVEGLARFFTGILFGMSIQARDGKSEKELRAQAEMAMATWPLTTKGQRKSR